MESGFFRVREPLPGFREACHESAEGLHPGYNLLLTNSDSSMRYATPAGLFAAQPQPVSVRWRLASARR